MNSLQRCPNTCAPTLCEQGCGRGERFGGGGHWGTVQDVVPREVSDGTAKNCCIMFGIVLFVLTTPYPLERVGGVDSFMLHLTMAHGARSAGYMTSGVSAGCKWMTTRGSVAKWRKKHNCPPKGVHARGAKSWTAL